MSSFSVAVYVTREHPETAHDQLLVLDDGDVPSGVGPAEQIVSAETGIEVRTVRELSDVAENHFVQATPTQHTPDAWEHRGTRCRWVQLQADLELSGAASALLPAIVRRRVVAYVTRERDGLTELLTIEAERYPEEGIQVPAGRIEHDETLEDGVHRELAEETGLTGVSVVRELADFECSYETYYENHAFHLVVEEQTSDEWRHEVHGDGVDAGLIHICRWVPVSVDLRLWNEGDPMLKQLPI